MIPMKGNVFLRRGMLRLKLDNKLRILPFSQLELVFASQYNRLASFKSDVYPSRNHKTSWAAETSQVSMKVGQRIKK
jgi:replication initiation and membrane attachment protein DnaB